tara:strand:- start:9 stop:539 length:531 start_codon:yes stop_codon:yes gene_type:complete
MIIGVVAAKSYSNRFPNKNKFNFEGEPLFWHSVVPLLESKMVDKIYVATDDYEIKQHCIERGVSVIWRNSNASDTDDKLINIIKFVYYSITEEPEIIVSIMANCPRHTSDDVERAIQILKTNSLREVRSYDNTGVENGILVLSREVLKKTNEISCYVGAISTGGKEIHYREEIENI